MKILKEYIFVFFLLTIIISYLFINFIDGNNVFASGDTLSPIAIKNSIKYYINTFGEFPFWFPAILGGIPTIHSFLYISNYYLPHQIMLILNDLGLPWIWYFIFHLIIGGLGIYCLLKFLNQNKLSAIFGSFLFLLMPYMITMTSFGHGSQMMSATYIPWIILFLFKIYEKCNLFNLSIFSFLIGFQLQRGHVQISYYTWMMIGLFIVISFINQKFFKNINIKDILKLNLSIFLSLLIGFFISLSIYFPILTYGNNSIRGAIDGGSGLQYATQWSMSLKEFSTFLFPYAMGFGGPLYFGDLPFTDFPNYIGLLVVILSIIGICKSKINYIYKLFFLLIIIFSLLISLGQNFIEFYKIFYNYFPHFNKFRVPSYILILTNFSLIILASCGLGNIVDSIQLTYKENKTYYFIFISGILISILYIIFGEGLIQNDNPYKSILVELIKNDSYIVFILSVLFTSTYFIFNFKKYNVKIFYIIIILIFTYDYYRIDQEIINPKLHIPHKKISKSNKYIKNYLNKDEIISYLLDDSSKYRIYDYVGNQNRWSIHGIEHIKGYHPAKLNNYTKFVNYIYSKGYKLFPEGILKLLNIKYLILPNSNFKHNSFTDLGKKNMYYFGDNDNYDGKSIDANLFLFNNNYSRLFYTNKVKYLNQDHIYNEILIDNYDPSDIVYVSEEIDDLSIDNSSRSVDLINWFPNKIEFRTRTHSDQFLVISEIFYPDEWTVKSNNKEHKIYEVNNIIRGIFVPKGEHYFIMEFSSHYIRNGLILSRFGFCVVIVIFLLQIYIKRRNESI